MIETSRITDIILPFKGAGENADNVSSISEAQLVREYGDSVYRFCLSLVYRREDADDLFQDTYLRAFSEIEKIKVSETPQGFLLSIAASLWKSRKRKYARRNRLAPEVEFDEAYFSETASPEDCVIADEEVLMVRALVNDLPEKLKLPVVMYYTVEMSVSDIAKTLKLPVGTVKSHLSRARGIIQKGLVKEYGNE
jgi:RNA polymerase sigma-70 factor (ECF subfamily)